MKNIREQATQETRTLAKYVKGKLGCTLAEFCRVEDLSRSTMDDRWNSPDGKIRVMDMVLRVYITRFEGL